MTSFIHLWFNRMLCWPDAVIKNNNTRTIFVFMNTGHCESSLGSFDEWQNSAKRPPTPKPSHLTWAVSPPVGCYHLQPPSPFIIVTQSESWYPLTVPRRVEGWVDLGTAGRVHTARAQGCKSQWFYDKHSCPQCDSIPGPRTLQSNMLPLDQCDLQYKYVHVLILLINII